MRCVTLALLLLAAPAGAVDWPVPRPVAGPVDPLAMLRWESLPSWVAASPVLPREALLALERTPAETATREGRRAVVLRLLGRENEAFEALQRARAGSTARHLADPDVALTAAYLDARRGRFDDACAQGVAALAQRPPNYTREPLALEVARWCLARGPAGFAETVATLDACAHAEGWSVLALVHRALVHARAGEVAEARALLDPVRAAVGLQLLELRAEDRHGATAGEVFNALGVALALNGNPARARPLLIRGLPLTPEVWRAWQERFLATLPGAP